MRIVPRNWRDFQHYKDRNPPWIRLHRKLLDNKDFHRLPIASRALAPMLWLLASESLDGSIDADPDDLAFRLRSTEEEISSALAPLIDKGFFDVVQDASKPLADSVQVAVPETETETETETVARKRAPARSIECPDDVEKQTWDDWVALRSRKKAPITATVLAEARRESEKAGMSFERFLAVWCVRGSQGLQASWLKENERGRAPPANGTDVPWANAR